MKLKQGQYRVGDIGKRRLELKWQQGDTKTTYLPTICSFVNDFRPPHMEYVGETFSRKHINVGLVCFLLKVSPTYSICGETFSRKHINVGLVWLQWWVGFSISIK